MDLLELNQFPSVAANSIASLVTRELLGRSLYALIFVQGGTFTKAHITDLRIGMSNKDFVEGITGTQLQSLNTRAGQSDTTNYLVHYFGDPTARTIRGQHAGDLDMSIYDAPLEIEVAIGAATSPTMQCWALVGPPKLQMNIGYNDLDALTVRAMIRSVLQPSAAVTRKSFEIGLGSEAGARIRSLNFFHTNLTSVEFKKRSESLHDDVPIALNNFVQTENARAPQSGLYVLDRIVDGNQGEAQSTVDANGNPLPFQVNVTTSAADTIKTFADVHTLLNLI